MMTLTAKYSVRPRKGSAFASRPHFRISRRNDGAGRMRRRPIRHYSPYTGLVVAIALSGVVWAVIAALVW